MNNSITSKQSEIVTRSVTSKRRRSTDNKNDLTNKEIENFIQNWKSFDKNTFHVSFFFIKFSFISKLVIHFLE